jgi:hypothetical protein
LAFAAAKKIDVDAHTAAMAELMESHLDSMMRSFLPVVEKAADFSSGAAVRISSGPGEFQKSYLEALDSMTIQFDEYGLPENITLIGGPDTLNQMKEALLDDGFRRELESILARKRKEYYAARDSRRLLQ